MTTTEPISTLDPAQPTYGYRPVGFAAPPAVSVITPYFNTGPIFLETARSLLRQSLQNWEWIIVNDGTTEADALRALLPFRSADGRIRVIDQPNRGLPAARNAGVAAARAPLLFFLDSDDLLAPTALEKLAWSLVSRAESAFVTSWQRSFGGKNFLWPRGFDTRYAFLYECMAAPTVMMRRTVFDAVGGFDETRREGLEDYEFWLRCAARGFWGHDVHEYLIAIRVKAAEQYRGYQWPARDSSGGMAAFRADMHGRYPQLFRDGLPTPARPARSVLDTYRQVPIEPPFTNALDTGTSGRRVLLLLPWMRFGGADRWALDIVRGLAERGDRVSVALTRDDMAHDWMDRLQRETSDVFDMGAFLERADFPRFLAYLITSRRVTHVLISNSLLSYRLLPYLRAHCPQMAMLDFQHMEEPWRDGGFPRISIEYTDMLDLQITNTAYLRQWMIARGADPRRIEVCTVNTDTTIWQSSPEQRAARATLGIAGETPVIAMIARLVPQKRPRLAAEIFRRLRDDGTPFVALVVGDGEDMGWFRRFVRRHRLHGHVRLLGARDAEGVRGVLASADLLLLPSDNEGLALVAQEAMAMHVVPVAADVGGMAELITPATGVLIPHAPDEIEQYTAALRELLHDPERRAVMARAGRERMTAHFDVAMMIDRMQALLDQASTNHTTIPRPPVSAGVGLVAASLAIEHEELERRLRGLLPVRALLALRRSSAWRALPNFGRVRALIERFDRAMYQARRVVMQRVRRG